MDTQGPRGAKKGSMYLSNLTPAYARVHFRLSDPRSTAKEIERGSVANLG